MPAAAERNGDQPARSAVVITSPPHLVGDTEYFIPELGRGARRALRPGEHIAVDHPLAVEYPGHFTPSREPIDAWPQGVITEDARKRQQAEWTRHASRPARKITFVCTRCGLEGASLITDDQPSQLALVNALSNVDENDPDGWAERSRIEQRFANAVKTYGEQQEALTSGEAAFRAAHLQCPEGTPVEDEPTVPDRVPLTWRLPGVRTLG
jgi:hypothetical protein